MKSQPDGRVAFDGEMRSAQHHETEQAAATPWARVAAAHGSLNVSRSSGGSTRGSSSSSARSLSLSLSPLPSLPLSSMATLPWRRDTWGASPAAGRRRSQPNRRRRPDWPRAAGECAAMSIRISWTCIQCMRPFVHLFEAVVLDKWSTSCPKATQSDLVPIAKDIWGFKRSAIENKPWSLLPGVEEAWSQVSLCCLHNWNNCDIRIWYSCEFDLISFG